MSKIKSVNPSSGKVLGEINISTDEEVREKIAKANKAKKTWGSLAVLVRVKILRKAAENLKASKEELAKTASLEMGMPINLARGDVDDSLRYFNWYLDNAEKYLSPEVIFEDEKIKHTVYKEPIGVSANITPWNFPVSNFVWSVPQSLISGNVVVYKTSEEVALCGKLIEEIIEKSRLPEGVFSEVYGSGEIGKRLVNEEIDMICFTGSTRTGQYLYKVAAEKSIRAFLELGGSAPGIVFEDADLERVLETIFANRFLYSGQVCDGLKRLIVHENIFDKVVEKLSERAGKARVGDSLDETTEIGPLVSEKQLLILEEQVEEAKEAGAKITMGGKRKANLPGFFFEPTILVNVTPKMKVWKEEVFGPALPIISFKTDEEAIKLANNTEYGLGAYVYTEDKERARGVAEKIETGMVSINNASYLQPCSPFGGCKRSGIGREHGKYGFNDLTQIKVVAEEK